MSDPAPLGNVLRFKDACAFLDVDPKTLRKLIRRGELPAGRVGRDWRFLRSELEAHLRKRHNVDPISQA
jgi:excisionase family DNA binding protein